MCEVVFFDETETGAVPAGIFVTLWQAPQPPNFPSWRRANTAPSPPRYDGVTRPGGVLINTNITLVPGSLYGAEFVGTQAPGMCTAHFVANATVDGDGNPLPSQANANNYHGPSNSQIGYATHLLELLPRGWIGEQGQVTGGTPFAPTGGTAFALAWALAAVLGSPVINGIVDADPADVDDTVPTLNNGIANAGHWSLDESTQQLLGSMRVQSATGTDIDSWARDILGDIFLRCINESDADWAAQILRILAILFPYYTNALPIATVPQVPKLSGPGLPTIAGLQAILDMFYPCFIREYQQVLALNISGGLGTWGGLDMVPGQPGTASIALGIDTWGYQDFPTTFMDVDTNVTIYETPSIVVFDAQSNPTLAGLLTLPHIAPPTFCVYFHYASFPDSGIHQILPFLPALDALIKACKATGTTVVYAANVT